MNNCARIFLIFGVLCLTAVSTAFFFKPDSNAKTPEAQETEVLANTEISAQDALDVRAIGDPNAPVVIQEFSSLTCGHCGNFHKGTFKELKEKYIDTGKVYWVFKDFPLNAPALHGSMIARCLPADRHENFIQALFENQNDWAYGVDYLRYLRQNAQFVGLSGDEFEACLQNEDLKNGIVNSIKVAQAKWEISSTPSFVVNDTVVLTGSKKLEDFEKIIKPLLKAAASEETKTE